MSTYTTQQKTECFSQWYLPGQDREAIEDLCQMDPSLYNALDAYLPSRDRYSREDANEALEKYYANLKNKKGRLILTRDFGFYFQTPQGNFSIFYTNGKEVFALHVTTENVAAHIAPVAIKMGWQREKFSVRVVPSWKVLGDILDFKKEKSSKILFTIDQIPFRVKSYDLYYRGVWFPALDTLRDNGQYQIEVPHREERRHDNVRGYLYPNPKKGRFTLVIVGVR